MKKTPFALCALLMAFSALAQNDSSRLDAGNLVLKRNFTQYISIKGEDLEKMPFSNLADAINVWLNGTYTASSNLVFVVDGNIVSDVNAYSIHDIDEVILLQNAAALSGTARGQQEMILITTRRSAAGLHVRGAAQTMLVHNPNTTTDFYHQYYAGVDKEVDKLAVGMSVNYLRDVSPMKQVGIAKTSPFHMDRWRLNGKFNWTPDLKNLIELRVSFVPETFDSSILYYSYPPGTTMQDALFSHHENDQQFSSWARWRGEWLPGLRNDLQVGYLHLSQKESSYELSHYTPPNQNNNFLVSDQGEFHARQFFVRDRISYRLHSGNWSFEPAVNASYQDATERYDANYHTEYGPNVGTPAGGVISYPSNVTANPGQVRLYVVTSSVDLSFKQVLNVQAGFVSNISHRTLTQAVATLPRTAAFGSIAVDALQLDGVRRDNSLKIFGSFSQRTIYSIDNFYLNDMADNNPVYRYYTSNPPLMIGTIYPVTDSTPVPQLGMTTLPKYWIWDAGAAWSTLNNRLRFDYNFERRNFSSMVVSNTGNGTYNYSFITMTTAQHRLGVSYHFGNGAHFSWQTGANVTVLQIGDAPNSTPYFIGDNTADGKKPSFTGGWVNRIQCRDFSFGLDLLYHFSKEIYSITNSSSYFVAGRKTGWMIQNIYAGYRIPTHRKTGLEIFADCRALATGGSFSPYNMPSNKKYYGLGANLIL
jgi:hypothetical protein